MSKSVLFVVFFILLFILLFVLNPQEPLDPLLHPLKYKDVVFQKLDIR